MVGHIYGLKRDQYSALHILFMKWWGCWCLSNKVKEDYAKLILTNDLERQSVYCTYLPHDQTVRSTIYNLALCYWGDFVESGFPKWLEVYYLQLENNSTFFEIMVKWTQQNLNVSNSNKKSQQINAMCKTQL